MQSAIVLDGNLKSALAIVRSLGEKGIFVSVGGERTWGMALHSRYTKDTFMYPSPYTDRAGFIRAVRGEAVRMGGKPVVFACSDATYLSLYDAREELGGDVTLVFPEEKAIEIAYDKAATYSLARVSNVPTITTHMPARPDDLERIAGMVQYPCVVKPRKSVTWKEGRGVFGSAQFIHSREELIRACSDLFSRIGEYPLIQERIVGEEYGVEMIAHRGVPLACLVHHRIRSLSPTGGASVLKETVTEGALHDMLFSYTKTLVLALGWEGPIMVEFKVDGDRKTPLLMEVNGRFWGSLPLSVAAGVDMPYVFYLLASGRRDEVQESFPKSGVVTRHFLGDVKHLMSVFFAHDHMRTLTYPSRREALRAFFRPPRGTQSDVWSLRDPFPAFYEIIDIIYNLRNRRISLLHRIK